MSKRPIDIEDLFHLTQYSDPQIDHKGETYVFTGRAINENQSYTEHLYVQDVHHGELRQWTFGNVKDRFPRFSPDDQTIVFLSNRSGIDQLWSISTNGGAPKQLTYLEHGAGKPHWSPGGRSLLFSAPVGTDRAFTEQVEKTKEEREKNVKKKEPFKIERLKYKSDAMGFHGQKHQQLILFDIETKTSEQLTTNEVDHNVGGWSPNGKKIAYTANLKGDNHIGQDIFIQSIGTVEETRQITASDGTYHDISWSPDGAKIACFGHTYTYDGATQNEIWTIDVSNGEKKLLTPDVDFEIGDAMISDFQSGQHNPGPVWENGQSIIFTASRFGRTGVFRASINGEIHPIFEENRHVYAFSFHKETDVLIAGISSPTDPGNFYAIPLDNGKITQRTYANDAYLSDIQLQEPHTVRFSANDGWEIEGWLLYPSNYNPEKKYPLILEVHGGPHAMYGYSFFHELQVLAGVGYAVLYTNPRGSHGYGQHFVDAVRGDYGGSDYTDLMAALDQTLERFSFIDDARLGVTGGSYGGFMTNWIISHTNRFKAAVTQRSIANWLSFYGVSDIGYYFTKWEIGEHLLDDPAKLWDHSPLKYARDVETPILILHGEQDLRCPIEQAEQWFTVLKYYGKEAVFVRFPDANHELSRNGPPRLRAARLAEIVHWFRDWI
ncbi:S9 family peptidase [Salicibibacter cibarius]|uniref:S9 family peptidase n=1 Tax=Salicibibacter cibarius TaxID=2743000 RepID=A0A7T6Z2D7_9BACI|nr:S9 family peptidase [Salicibibacter cibarius]QQK75699.1 S9 family peptidase [Salicibibacter cibarius]